MEKWIKKLGVCVYEDEEGWKGKKFGMVMDERMGIKGEKVVLGVGIG